MFRRGAIIALAVALTGAALLVRLRLGFAEGDAPLLILFVVPIAACAYVGGALGGLSATVLSLLASAYFLLTPTGSFRAARPIDQLQWVVLAVTGAVITAAFASLLRSRARIERAEALRRESTTLLSAISDASMDVIFAKDRDGRLRFANPATLKLVGKTAEQALGRTDLEFLGDEAAARMVMETDRTVMESGVATEVEEVVPLEDGTERIWLSRKFPYRDASGEVAGLLGISRDITERKRAEAALRESEHRYRSLFTNMSEGFALGEVVCEDGAPCDIRFTEMNEAFERHTGLKPSEVVGRQMREVLPGLEQRWIDAYCGVALTGKALRFESYNRDLDRHFSVFSYSPGPGRFASIFTDVTDRTRAEEQVRRNEAALQRANAQLREMDRRKDEFLSMLSHELRNPLAPIRTAVYILNHAEPDGEQARRARSVIERQAEHLTRLVDDLLDVTRIARGKIELRRDRIDVGEVARRAAEDQRSVMEARGVKLGVDLDAAVVWVDADATRIAQVVGNLLQNAGKFTPAGGQVSLSVRASPSSAELRVRDTGIGIEPELLAHVFEPFVQSDRSLARAQGGLGLGLALVRAIVELHGGTVRADSGGPGRGAEFVVTLPLAEAPAAGRAWAPQGLRAASRGRRVLVVDDNVDAAETLGELVALFGHTAVLAHDGPTAIAKARATSPDVVLCDIGLPGMSGYEVARALRAERPERDPAHRGLGLRTARGRLARGGGWLRLPRREAARSGRDRPAALLTHAAVARTRGRDSRSRIAPWFRQIAPVLANRVRPSRTRTRSSRSRTSSAGPPCSRA